MEKSELISEAFGDDVLHLHGNLYRVKRRLVRVAKPGLSVRNGRIVYGNPRWFKNGRGEFEARGVESSKMDELKESIRGSGLDNPIRLRPIYGDDPHLEVVNGERRFRCIEELCEEDAKCRDSSSNEDGPASEVYESIDCRIEYLDDEDAIAIALKTNETSEVIGDQASIQVVRALRAASYDDQDILRATGKSLSWLRETDRIISLDEVCLGHFEEDRITRKAAIQLALIENAEERLEILESILKIARDRHSVKLNVLDKKVEEAEERELVNKSAAKVARSIGDEKQADKLDAAGNLAADKASKARADREKASSKTAKADMADIKKARNSKAPPPPPSIESIYLDKIQEIIDNDGFDEDGDSMGVDVGVLVSVLGVLESMVSGDEDVASVLALHCPLVNEDESLEDEDEDEEETEERAVDEDDPYADSSSDDGMEETPPELESEFSGMAREEDFD
jgi:hypothetical protein